jgi:hypothetical protein
VGPRAPDRQLQRSVFFFLSFPFPQIIFTEV